MIDKKYVYLLWEDNVMIDAYTSREKAEEMQEKIINGYNSGIVTYANENCGFTTIVMPFGEKIKFEIAEIEVT